MTHFECFLGARRGGASQVFLMDHKLEYDKAEKELRASLEIQPNYANARYNLQQLLNQKQKTKTAEASKMRRNWIHAFWTIVLGALGVAGGVEISDAR